MNSNTKELIDSIKKSDNSTTRLFKGISWSVLGLIFNKGFTMVSSILIARFLGTNSYGEYGMINSTITMFATFAGLGLGITATKFVAEFSKTDKAKVERVLGLSNLLGIISGIIMMIIVLSTSDWLSINQLNNPQLSRLIQISSITLVFSTYNGVQRGALSGFEEFSALAKIDGVIGIFSCVSMILGTLFMGLTGLMIATVLISILTVILCTLRIKPILKRMGFRVNYKEFYKEFGVFIQISLPSLISGILVGPVTWAANSIFIQTAGYSQLGIFNAANQWKLFLSLLPQTLNAAILPILISTKLESSSKINKLNLTLSWIVAIVIGLPLINLPDVISFFYGKQYISYSYNVCIVLCILTSIVMAYKDGVARAMLSEGCMWRGVADNCVWGITLIFCTYLLRGMGAVGLALSFIISYIVTAVIFIPYNIFKGTVRKDYIFSKPIVFGWLFVIFQVAITLLNFSIYVRLFLFALNVGLVIYYVRRLYLARVSKLVKE